MDGRSGKSDEANYISQDQIHEISMLALQKGAALQRILNVTNKNASNVRAMKNALFKLKVYAFGDEHQPTISSAEQKGSFRFSQVQLKLLRQEQLMLLSENQRLVDELQKIRKMNLSSFVNPNPPQAPAPTHSNVRTSKLVKSIDRTLMGENEVNLVRTKLLYFVATVEKAKQRVYGYTLRALASFDRDQKFNQVNYLNPHRYYTLTKKAGCLLLENVLQKKVRAQLAATFSFIRNNTMVKPPRQGHQFSPKSAKDVKLIGVHQAYQSKLPSVRKHMMNL